MNLDGNLMAGVLHEPAKTSKTLIIVIHGWTGDKSQTHVRHTAAELSRAGYATYRIDLSGNGDSEGRFEDATPTKQLRDVVAVTEHFRKKYSKIILLGFSDGGMYAVIAASRVKVDGVISIAASVHPGDFDKRFTPQQTKELISVGFTTITKKRSVGDVPYVITDQFVRERKMLHPLDDARNVLCPALVVHGTEDKSVAVDDAQELFQVLHWKDLLLIGGADHSFTNPQHLDALIAGVLDWLEKLK